MTVLSLMLISLGILVVRVGDSLTKSPLLQLGMTNWNITTLKAGTGLERRQYLSMRSSHGAQETAGAGPGGGVLLAVDLPHVLLVVEYLLVPAPRSVLHVGQGPDPTRHLELQLLVVDLEQEERHHPHSSQI